MSNELPFPSDTATRQVSHAGCVVHAASGLETATVGMDTAEANRRPIKARGNPFIQRLARRMAEAGITPNSISVASVVFAALGAVCLLVSPVGWGAIACAVGIQLRLLCNLIDGMVAVEGGRKTPTGALYNEVPDRVADSVLLVFLGYAVGVPWLGWMAALAAACTAYVRVLGGSLGLVQSFRGPMAKQHRMALMTGACLLSPLFGTTGLLHLALILMAVGALITCGTRLKGIAAQLC